MPFKSTKKINNQPDLTDCLIVGGGIMGITLASLLNELDSSIKINLYEKLNSSGLESSEALNNAGTGHAGYCELNYTPIGKDGKVKITKALEINAKYEITLQYWSYLTNAYKSFNPKKFINRTPHVSLVFGDKNIHFLKKRYLLLKKHHLFKSITFSQDRKKISQWAKLTMMGRDPSQKVAATIVNEGADINFGAATNAILNTLKNKKNFKINLNHEILTIKDFKNNLWDVSIRNKISGEVKKTFAKFIFIGAGGYSIRMLQKTGIQEQNGYAGFPVSGQWLICSNKKIVKQHNAKVYGMPPEGSPPMSVPHFDLRIINGRKTLLFGPYAGFTFKFLKTGSYLDLIKSLKLKNFFPLIYVLIHNWKLFNFLIYESFQLKRSRMNSLKIFYPDAKEKDWSIKMAGQRVQIIKPTSSISGKLEFGTEVIFSKNKKLAALLGASPGASIAVDSMIKVIEQCFSEKLLDTKFRSKMKEMIPSYGQNLIKNKQLLKKIRLSSHKTLGLTD
jgi:malate dehydrogenase (quinone)